MAARAKDPDVGIEFVVDFGAVFQVIAVPDGFIAHVAVQFHALGGVKGYPAGHGVVDRAILHIGILRHFARRMEVDGIMSHPPPLPHLEKLNPLHLAALNTLPDYGMTAEVIAFALPVLNRRIRERCIGIVTLRLDADAPGQQRHGGPCFGGRGGGHSRLSPR